MIHNTQSAQISQKQDEDNIYVIMKICMLLCSSCVCEIWAFQIWAFCVSSITYDHLYYTPCLACWALFGPLVPAMCNRTSCAQVHELPQNHCGDNWVAYCVHNIYIYIYIYIHIYIYVHIYIYIYIIQLFLSLLKCSISCKIK